MGGRKTFWGDGGEGGKNAARTNFARTEGDGRRNAKDRVPAALDENLIAMIQKSVP